MDWIVAQPWSNGQVYEFGASADGMYSYLSLKIPQPHLKGSFYMWSNSLMYFTVYQGILSLKEKIIIRAC